jgi:hypothetical protein
MIVSLAIVITLSYFAHKASTSSIPHNSDQDFIKLTRKVDKRMKRNKRVKK